MKLRLVKLDPAREYVPVDVRRAEAVLQTRKLRLELFEGRISRQTYLNHIRELALYVSADPDPLGDWRQEMPTRTVSGQRLKVVPPKEDFEPSLDALLISYLLGVDGYEESEDTRFLGSW